MERHQTDDGVEGEGEKGHGEGASLFDSGGEEDGESDNVVDVDVVEVVVVKLFYAVNVVLWEAHEMENKEEVETGERGEGSGDVVGDDPSEGGVLERKSEGFGFYVHDVVRHLSCFDAGL